LAEILLNNKKKKRKKFSEAFGNGALWFEAKNSTKVSYLLVMREWAGEAKGLKA